MKIDSFVFHALGGLANAARSAFLLIPRKGLCHKALRPSAKVFHRVIVAVETLRALHEAKSAHAMPRASTHGNRL
jgi:hypothetical protein